MADAVLAVLRRHVAYLWPETVLLSLESGAADADQRQALATALLSQLETVEPEDAELCLGKPHAAGRPRHRFQLAVVSTAAAERPSLTGTTR